MQYYILHAQETSTAVKHAFIEELQDILCNPCLYNPMHDEWHQPNGRLKCAVIIIITADWMSPQI